MTNVYIKRGQISQEEKSEAYEEMLRSFIPNADGLAGMLLIAIRETDHSEGKSVTAIEVNAACTKQDIYRSAAAIVESMLQRDGESGGYKVDKEEAMLCSLVADCLLGLAGDDPEHVEKVFTELNDKMTNN